MPEGTASPESDAPANASELLDGERILASLAGAKKLLLAVSGGPDSVALMLVMASCAGRDTVPVEVATVDHGLRSGSHAEAVTVGDWARSLGFAHHVLTWEGEKPTTRIQERAREARYRLLQECALAIGADHVVTAHHADDQAETVLLRLTRGSGPAGLAGMSQLTRLGEVALARPLLDLPKDELVAICEAADHPYFRDPSNDDPAFARTRLRKLRTLIEAEGLDRTALLRLARRAARAEAALRHTAEAARLQLQAERHADAVRISGQALTALPAEIFLRVLEAEIVAIAPDGGDIRLDRLENAAAQVAQALRERRAFGSTLGGAKIAATPDGDLEITLAPARRNHTQQKETTISEFTALARGRG
jgi:tRNA(Ile)-lysidine synthase